MVPLKLELKNFLSYGELQSIDFSKHNLICLSGKNGHGKSAILDAITWAIWGQARKPGGVVKPDESLLRLGQTKMFVILELKIDQQLYRIRREFVKSLSKGIANLEFFIYSQAQGYMPVTEKTIRQTQRKIDAILKIDYETFTNSSFLRQGNSGEFSKKSPRERKLLLTKILGFDLYDKMQQKALDLVRDKNLRLKSILSEEQKNLELIKELPELIEKKKTITNQLIIEKGLLIDVKNQKLMLDEQRMILNNKIEETRLLIDQKKEVENNIVSMKNRAAQAIASWRAAHAHIIKAKNLGVTVDHKQALVLSEEDLAKIEMQLMEKLTLNKKITDLKNQLSTDAHNLAEHEKQKNAAEKIWVSINETCAEIDLLTKGLNQKSNFSNMLLEVKSKIKKIEKIMVLFFEKKRLAKNLLEKNKNNELSTGSCPICSQEISEEVSEKINRKHRNLISVINHQLRRIEFLLPEYEKKLKELRAEENYIEVEIKKKQAILGRIEFLQIQLLKEQKEEAEIRISITKAESDYVKNCSAEQEVQLKELELYLESLSGVEASFALRKGEVLKLKVQVSIFLEVEKKKAELSFSRERWLDFKKTIQSLLKVKNQLELKLSNTDQLKKNYFELKAKWEIISAKITASEQSINILFQENATFEVMIEMRNVVEKNSILINQEIESLKKDIFDTEILAEAFGKNGIQAFLIEDVIPEIENATNQILSVISETQAKVFIEPLKDLKKGGVKESLDITISDTSGIRDYEMFSGGEAFRIDFALRIGISQVIAKRSGASLKTLIIDEGFGALDDEGISLMMNCIYRIVNHFEKVIVVSHLPALKEMFPVHLHVTKGGSGSFVSVEFRG